MTLRMGLLFILATLAFSFVAVPALAAPGSTDPTVNRQLAAVRAATAKYHDPAAALADGYLPTEFCVASPNGRRHGHALREPQSRRQARPAATGRPPV